MAKGKRRQGLMALAAAVFDELNLVLPFTSEAAAHYAQVTAIRRLLGRSIGAFDALIAASALAAGVAVATRDVAGFEDCGLTLINPWEAA